MIALLGVICLVVIVVYLMRDLYPARRIRLDGGRLAGIAMEFAPGLVIQGGDEQGNVWATRGFWAYRASAGENVFYRQYRIPSRRICRLANFSAFRRFISRDVWVELLPFSNGEAIAASSNRLWIRSTDGRFTPTFSFKYPLTGVGGVGVGTGFLPTACLALYDGRVLFGEYWRNRSEDAVDIYASSDRGHSWQAVYRFEPGAVRHVHSLQQDPIDGSIWVCTGDDGEQVKIINTKNFFRDVDVLGESSQTFRAVGLAFDDGHICWSTDTADRGAAGIFRIDRKTRELEKIAAVSGCSYMTAQVDGGITAISEARQGSIIETDDSVGLYLVKGSRTTRIPLGSWKKNRFFKTYSWARLGRIPRSSTLFLTPLNTDKYAGALIAIQSSALASALDASVDAPALSDA